MAICTDFPRSPLIMAARAADNPDPALGTLDSASMIRTVDQVSGLVVSRVDPTYKDRPEVLTLKIDAGKCRLPISSLGPGRNSRAAMAKFNQKYRDAIAAE